MAKININNTITVNGKLSFSRTLIDAKNNEMQIMGILQTHLYFEEINEIKTERYRLKGVQVYKEDYGSDDYNILYSFKAEDLDILGVEVQGITFVISPENIERIEEVMYKDDVPILGCIGEEYKDLLKFDGDDDDSEQ